MTETKHGVDASFNDRLNILRAGVLGANDGIISIAGVVIGVASATSNLWIIFLSGLSAILAGAFSMAGGEYVSVEAAVSREQALLDRDPKAARDSLYAAYIQNGECETAAQIMTERAFLKHPLKALVEEKYGLEFEEFTNPWHAAMSSFVAFVLGSLPPMLSILLFTKEIRIPATVIIVALSLLFTGYTSAKLGKAPTKQAMIRNLVIGLLTMGVTYLFGQLFSI